MKKTNTNSRKRAIDRGDAADDSACYEIKTPMEPGAIAPRLCAAGGLQYVLNHARSALEAGMTVTLKPIDAPPPPKSKRSLTAAEQAEQERGFLNRRLLAERITKHLFAPEGQPRKADRLALIFDGKDTCGWGYAQATNAVQGILDSDAATDLNQRE